MSGVRGRRITSSVHNYFKILDEKNDDGKVLAACQINDKSGKVCGTIVSSADYATNLKHHLNKVHPDIFGIVKKADAEKPKKENSKDSDLSQQTLKQAFFGQKSTKKVRSKIVILTRRSHCFLAARMFRCQPLKIHYFEIW